MPRLINAASITTESSRQRSSSRRRRRRPLHQQQQIIDEDATLLLSSSTTIATPASPPFYGDTKCSSSNSDKKKEEEDENINIFDFDVEIGDKKINCADGNVGGSCDNVVYVGVTPSTLSKTDIVFKTAQNSNNIGLDLELRKIDFGNDNDHDDKNEHDIVKVKQLIQYHENQVAFYQQKLEAMLTTQIKPVPSSPSPEIIAINQQDDLQQTCQNKTEVEPPKEEGTKEEDDDTANNDNNERDNTIIKDYDNQERYMNDIYQHNDDVEGNITAINNDKNQIQNDNHTHQRPNTKQTIMIEKAPSFSHSLSSRSSKRKNNYNHENINRPMSLLGKKMFDESTYKKNVSLDHKMDPLSLNNGHRISIPGSKDLTDHVKIETRSKSFGVEEVFPYDPLDPKNKVIVKECISQHNNSHLYYMTPPFVRTDNCSTKIMKSEEEMELSRKDAKYTPCYNHDPSKKKDRNEYIYIMSSDSEDSDCYL
jgi:hypothetical protein